MHRSFWFFAHTRSSLLSAGNSSGVKAAQALSDLEPSYAHPITAQTKDITLANRPLWKGFNL